VRGYKEEGTTTTPFDMVVLNDLDRFHLVMDVIDRVPSDLEQLGFLVLEQSSTSSTCLAVRSSRASPRADLVLARRRRP
jgi:phosphoketolase